VVYGWPAGKLRGTIIFTQLVLFQNLNNSLYPDRMRHVIETTTMDSVVSTGDDTIGHPFSHLHAFFEDQKVGGACRSVQTSREDFAVLFATPK
jgi:hypothetical protein